MSSSTRILERALAQAISVDGAWNFSLIFPIALTRFLRRTGWIAYAIWQSGHNARLPRTPRTPRSTASSYFHESIPPTPMASDHEDGYLSTAASELEPDELVRLLCRNWAVAHFQSSKLISPGPQQSYINAHSTRPCTQNRHAQTASTNDAPFFWQFLYG
jgi:hypothetical protein